jgi:hypothetical protein
MIFVRIIMKISQTFFRPTLIYTCGCSWFPFNFPLGAFSDKLRMYCKYSIVIVRDGGFTMVNCGPFRSPQFIFFLILDFSY